MPFKNPFASSESNEPEVKPEGEAKPPEKSQAELIAESITAALNHVVTSLKAVSDKVNSFEQRLPQPKAPASNNETVQLTSVFEDEDRAIYQRVAPLMQRQLETDARLARQDIKDEFVAKGYGNVWAQYADEINKILDESPLVDNSGKSLRGDPAYIRNVVSMVFGRAAMAAGMKFGGKDKGFFIESAAGSTDAGVNTGPGSNMTEGQKKVFARMKVPLAEAEKTIAKLKFVS